MNVEKVGKKLLAICSAWSSSVMWANLCKHTVNIYSVLVYVCCVVIHMVKVAHL